MHCLKSEEGVIFGFVRGFDVGKNLKNKTETKKQTFQSKTSKFNQIDLPMKNQSACNLFFLFKSDCDLQAHFETLNRFLCSNPSVDL